MQENLLGKHTRYPSRYDASLMRPVLRAENRGHLNSKNFIARLQGFDIWHAYELSWLNQQGKPENRLGSFIVPCNSTNLIESKSLKLYLNSLNQERFEHPQQVQSLLEADLSAVAKGPVTVIFSELNQANSLAIKNPTGVCLDALNISTEQYFPQAELLELESGNGEGERIEELLYSDLLKSNCPVTGQPDWGSVFVEYKGKKINHVSLLKYIISYRQHSGFHEHCVESIFSDILRVCMPDELTVYACYLRRGGLDINPVRSTKSLVYENFQYLRLCRQ